MLYLLSSQMIASSSSWSVSCLISFLHSSCSSFFRAILFQLQPYWLHESLGCFGACLCSYKDHLNLSLPDAEGGGNVTNPYTVTSFGQFHGPNCEVWNVLTCCSRAAITFIILKHLSQMSRYSKCYWYQARSDKHMNWKTNWKQLLSTTCRSYRYTLTYTVSGTEVYIRSVCNSQSTCSYKTTKPVWWPFRRGRGSAGVQGA